MSSIASVSDLVRVPNALEGAAIRLHDHMWENMGPNEEWLLEITGDDDTVMRLIRLLNELQDEILTSGIPHRDYRPK